MTLQEVLRENKLREREFKKEQIRKAKREQRKEFILTMFVASFILLITLMFLSRINNNFMNDCLNAGHSETYCEIGM